MGYRGEDVSTTHGAWGHQTPWQSSSDDYQGAGDGDPGYPGQGQSGQGQSGYAGYGQQDEQYGGPYGQQPQADQYGQPYQQYDGYEQGAGGAAGGWGTPGDGWNGAAGGYGGQQEYGQGDYGYERGTGSGGYPQGGYDQAPTPGYGQSGGYPGPAGGYQGQAGGGYPGQDAGYPGQDAGYQGQSGGYQGQSSGYSQSGGYQEQRPSGGYPALPAGAGSYPAQDAGNDWYGGQPDAARGGSFADTGTYRFNGRAIDEYGTGPRGALRDPVRGYAPGPNQDPRTGPTSVIPAVSGPQPVRRSGQQERLDDSAQYRDGYAGPAGHEAYDGYDDYGTRADLAGPGGYRGAGYQAPLPSAGLDRDRGGYDEYQDPGDPYQDPYGDDGGPATPRGSRRNGGKRTARGPLDGKRLLLAALAVTVVGVVAVAAYVFLLKPKSTAVNPNAQGALPTGSAAATQQACNQPQLGMYCHIAAATGDPTPLTTAELFPPAFTNEADKISYSLVSTKLDKTCANAVIGADLIKQLKAGDCSQVARASYVSGDGKIMGTIGVVNLSTTNQAHYAGKVVGQADFIAPLTAAKGVASKLGKGTGVVEAEYKGHYLILTWSEFVNGTTPSTKAQDTQLEQFSNDLVAGTANIDLSQRMVTGTAPTPAASTPAASTSSSAKASATASAKASATKS
jgi:hypothetical protein